MSALSSSSVPTGRPLAGRRRDAYAFFAHLFTEPTSAELLADVLTGEPTAAFSSFQAEQLLRRVRVAAARHGVTKIRQDFRALFAGEPAAVSLCESAYVPGGVASPRVAYAAGGFDPTALAPLPPDHVAVEMWFLSRLCELESAITEPGPVADARAAAARFLGEHLARWLPSLARAAGRRASTRFYRDLFVLARAFVDWDARYLRLAAREAETAW